MASVLDFITTNPFNESFNDAMDAASDEQNKAAQRAVNEARLQEIISQAPLDTRTKLGQANKAAADAAVAEGSVFDKLAQERNKAGYTEGQMVGQQQENAFKADLHPLDVSKAQGNAAYAHNQAATESQRGLTETHRTRGAAADADVAVGTVGPRINLAQQKTANEVLTGEKIDEQIRGERITNDTNYSKGPFLVEDAANQANKSGVEVDTAENARTTAENNKKISAAKLEQEVFKIGASAGANAARAFAISNGVDLSPEALESLNNEVYMTTMKGVMEQLDARMPGDANILARDAALDKISPLVLQASKTNKPVDYAAIEAIISPVTPSVPAVKTGGGGKVWTMPDLMREARLYAESVSKDPIGGVDKAKFDAEYAAKLKELSAYLGKPVEEEDPTVAPGQGSVRRLNPGEFIQNADGTQSTERSITVMNPKLNGGRPTNIPSIWNVDGKVVELPFGQPGTEDQAVEFALRTGEQFQSFNSIPEAEAAAQARSNAGGRFQDASPAPTAAPAAAQPAAPAAPPQQAVEFLKTNATPEMRKYFDLKYGAGAAAKVLGN